MCFCIIWCFYQVRMQNQMFCRCRAGKKHKSLHECDTGSILKGRPSPQVQLKLSSTPQGPILDSRQGLMVTVKVCRQRHHQNRCSNCQLQEKRPPTCLQFGLPSPQVLILFWRNDLLGLIFGFLSQVWLIFRNSVIKL